MDENITVWFSFTRENYGRFMEIFSDSDHFPRAYDDWLAETRRDEEIYNSRGFQVIREKPSPDEFAVWCKANGFNQINYEARAHFVDLKIREYVNEL